MSFFISIAASHPAAAETMIPLSGKAVAGMGGVDSAYSEFMAKYGIPGGSVAIMKDGKLVYARGFGMADREAKRPVTPDTLFRIASLSKPITALAVVSLVEEGKLTYDLKAFPYLGYPTPTYHGAKRDPRLDTITVRQLLQHSGGWDRGTAFDPMFSTNAASLDLTGKNQPPARAEQIARWMVGKPLQFDPGTRYAYSNLGYCVLGRVIEKASGQDYETYMRSILAKAGITSMRIGGSKIHELLENETRYYDASGKRGNSVWGEKNIPDPHTFSIQTLDSHGGWIASATDLVRFTTLFDNNPEPADLIKPESMHLIHTRPSFAPPAAKISNYYGFGWSFWESSDAKNRNWFHTGSLSGTMSQFIRSDNGITWAALFNLRPQDSATAFSDLDKTMWKAVNSVTKWAELTK